VKTNPRLDRRQFLFAASGSLLGLALPGQLGCERAGEADGSASAEQTAYPFLEVSGSPYDVGLAIGRRFGEQVRSGLERRREWFTGLRDFMLDDRATRMEPFVAAAEEHFPDVVEELRGWASGAELAFEDLLALNLKAELATMKKSRVPETPGCSTLALAHAGRTLLAHNADGNGTYGDLMFLVRVTQPGKPAFTCLTYPGILCGNGPAINEAGIIVTTNYIGGLDVRPGVPRYVISRAAIQADSVVEAVKTMTHPERAFSFHYNLGSLEEQRILSVESSVDRYRVWEVEGLYVHTNHLVQPEMETTPQDTDYVSTSSMPRYRVLSAGAQRLQDRLDEVTEQTLLTMLSSHEGAPYSPCRHPAGQVSGATLGTALFDVGAGSRRLLYSNPCRRIANPRY
jgi:hypothetical protein